MPDVYVAEKNEKKSEKKSKKREGESVTKKPDEQRHEREYSQLMREEPRTTNPFSAFMVRPRGFRFETQESREKILLLLRRHPITNLGWILVALLMLVAPVIFRSVPILGLLPPRFQLITLVGWYLLVFGYIFEQFLNWYFNVYVVTDERIIDFDFYSLIYKRVSEAKIDRIEDITVQMTGVNRSIFNYGSVLIQTAGESREFEFEDAPQPQKIAKFLNELVLEEEREKIEGRVM